MKRARAQRPAGAVPRLSASAPPSPAGVPQRSSRVRVQLSRQIPEATQTWDTAHALGVALIQNKPALQHVTVSVHANRRELLRWQITNVADLSLHWALVPHTEHVLAVIDGDQRSWEELVGYLPAAPLPRLTPRGRVHDLGPLLHAQQTHVGRVRVPKPADAATAKVTWGRFAGRAPSRVLRLGSCDGGAPPVIRIHPVLDDESVPAWFVGFVLFHELLHVVLPPTIRGTKRVVHPPAFRRAERVHPDYDRSLEWERLNIPTLLARCRQRTHGG